MTAVKEIVIASLFCEAISGCFLSGICRLFCLPHPLRFWGRLRLLHSVRSNYVECQEYAGLKSSPFLSMALRIVSILCMQATKATFFSFPAASNR